MELREPKYARTLFIAFAAVVLTFILATVYVNWRTLEVGAQTHNVSLNALPSIAYLIAVRDDLRDLEVMGAAYPTRAPDARATARDAMELKWRDVDHALSSYATLPVFPGEHALYATVPAALRASDEALRELVERVDTNDLSASAGAELDVHQRIAEANAKLRDVVQLNLDQARDSTERIEDVHDHTAAAALTLDGIAVIVAIIATLWVSRLFGRHSRLVREHGDLVEQRATELEDFGKRVAHDLLSPLSSLTYCLTAFKQAALTDPTLADAVTRARTCVLRAQTMVDGIFEFARSGGRPEAQAATPLGEVVEQVVDEVRSSELRSRPEIDIEPFSEAWVACNRGVLTSVLSNLLRNAQKFMSDSPVRKITVRAHEESGRVRVEVEDTGPGIPPEIREAIFEPYVRADGATQPGLGLGLATVKRLCTAHEGEVGVRSTLGRGSVFWFTLPTAKPRATTLEAVLPKIRSVS